MFVLSIVPLVSSDGDPLSWLVNYGVAGIIIILLVTGQLRTKAEVAGKDKVIADQAETIKIKDQALTAIMTQVGGVLPQIAQLSQVVEALPANKQSIESQILTRLEALGQHLEEIERRAR